MILKLLITLIFVGTSVLKLTGKVAPDWNRWGYPRQFMYATGIAELFALALFWWPGLEILGAAGLGFVLLGALATLGRYREGLSHIAFTAVTLLAVQAALGLRPGLEVFGTDYPTRDGTCIRDYIQVSDLVAAHLVALGHLRKGGESLICNCGYGRGVSVFEVVDAVRQVSGADFKVRISGRRPGDPASLVAGTKRIKAVLGWTPKYDDLPTIVGQALDWERRLRNKSVTGQPLGANSLECDAV